MGNGGNGKAGAIVLYSVKTMLKIVNRSFLNRIAVTVIAEIIGQIAALSLAVFSRFTAAEIVVVIRCNAEEP